MKIFRPFRSPALAKLLWLPVALLIFGLQPSPAKEAPPPCPSRLVSRLEAGRPQTVVFYGTSLTARGAWSCQVSETLGIRYPGLLTVHNGASSGKNSRWGLEAVQERVIAHRPDTVMIEFTINDSVARFGISSAESRDNLEAIIDRIRAELPEVEIILQIMNPVVGKPYDDPSYRRDQPAYAEVYREVARRRKLRLIDHRPAWDKILAEGGESAFKELVRDGIHPGEEASRKIITPAVLRELGVPGMRPDGGP